MADIFPSGKRKERGYFKKAEVLIAMGFQEQNEIENVFSPSHSEEPKKPNPKKLVLKKNGEARVLLFIDLDFKPRRVQHIHLHLRSSGF